MNRRPRKNNPATAGRTVIPEKLTLQLAEAVFVEGHAYGGVHVDFLEGGDFADGFDAAGGDDGMT